VKRPRHNTASAGFTLLEVMIALVIVATALMALLSLGNRSIDVHDRLQKTTRATMLAQYKMAEFESSGLPEERDAESFAEPFEEYRWRFTVAETPLPSIIEVKVIVAWGNEQNNEAVDLTSFLLQ
jgi:general secretion pathway protein I